MKKTYIYNKITKKMELKQPEIETIVSYNPSYDDIKDDIDFEFCKILNMNVKEVLRLKNNEWEIKNAN